MLSEKMARLHWLEMGRQRWGIQLQKGIQGRSEGYLMIRSSLDSPALQLMHSRFSNCLKENYNGDITRSAVELAKQWRLDKALRNLDALMITSDGDKMFLISGAGDVIEPEGNVVAIGSGGDFARAAALAYLDAGVDWSAEEIARRAVNIAADICIYTNHNIITEVQNGSTNK